MRKSFLYVLLVSLIVTLSGYGQSPTDVFSPGDINIKYLEHLVKTKIDDVRLAHDCEPLVNDSILYIAATYHANYMLTNSRLSHYENNIPATKTPQLRADHFGAINYQVGENVLKTAANNKVRGKTYAENGRSKSKVFDTNTYEGLANSIVSGWVNSPGHFKNIITPDYQITGLGIVEKNGAVYACQKFATVLYKYEFEEPKALFAYSNFKKKHVAKSFDGIDSNLIKHKYEWGLKHNKLEKCETCLDLVKQNPGITLRIERGNFILRIENSAYVQELIQDKRDGFAVEIVTYSDYACGNPAYYTKPSRRNGQLKTNGRILKPVYKKDLIRGFKKRKKKKDMRFLPYLFGASDVKFKNRISQYKMALYDSKYFEMKIGKVPKDINGLWAHNLLYIQEKQICHVDYFTSYCGAIVNDSIPFDFIPLGTVDWDYTFKPEKKELNLVIPFERNKADYTSADIKQFTAQLNDFTYTIDSIYIQAFSSVEGDASKNDILQQKRAESIVEALIENQVSEVPITIETKNSWDDFRQKIGRMRDYRHLANASETEITQALLHPKALEDLEPILSKERKALLKINLTIFPEKANYNYLIEKEFKALRENQAEYKPNSLEEKEGLMQFEALYSFTHKRVRSGESPVSLLADQNLPKTYYQYPALAQKFILYGEEFRADFSKNQQWVKEKDGARSALISNFMDELYPEFIYYDCYLQTKKFQKISPAIKDEVQYVFNKLLYLQSYYNQSAIARENIDRLTFNLNMILLHTVLTSNPAESAVDAQKALSQVLNFYNSRELLTEELAFSLSEMAVFYGNISQAAEIDNYYIENMKFAKHLAAIGFNHPSERGTEPYYQYLLELREKIPTNQWCNLFINSCKIPFQAFDHEELRDVFCAECQDKNDFLKGEY